MNKKIIITLLVILAVLLFGCTSSSSLCGDGICQSSEDQITCSTDCGEPEECLGDKCLEQITEKNKKTIATGVQNINCDPCTQKIQNNVCVSTGKQWCGTKCINPSLGEICCGGKTCDKNERCNLDTKICEETKTECPLSQSNIAVAPDSTIITYDEYRSVEWTDYVKAFGEGFWEGAKEGYWEMGAGMVDLLIDVGVFDETKYETDPVTQPFSRLMGKVSLVAGVSAVVGETVVLADDVLAIGSRKALDILTSKTINIYHYSRSGAIVLPKMLEEGVKGSKRMPGNIVGQLWDKMTGARAGGLYSTMFKPTNVEYSYVDNFLLGGGSGKGPIDFALVQKISCGELIKGVVTHPGQWWKTLTWQGGSVIQTLGKSVPLSNFSVLPLSQDAQSVAQLLSNSGVTVLPMSQLGGTTASQVTYFIQRGIYAGMFYSGITYVKVQLNEQFGQKPNNKKSNNSSILFTQIIDANTIYIIDVNSDYTLTIGNDVYSETYYMGYLTAVEYPKNPELNVYNYYSEDYRLLKTVMEKMEYNYTYVNENLIYMDGLIKESNITFREIISFNPQTNTITKENLTTGKKTEITYKPNMDLSKIVESDGVQKISYEYLSETSGKIRVDNISGKLDFNWTEATINYNKDLNLISYEINGFDNKEYRKTTTKEYYNNQNNIKKIESEYYIKKGNNFVNINSELIEFIYKLVPTEDSSNPGDYISIETISKITISYVDRISGKVYTSKITYPENDFGNRTINYGAFLVHINDADQISRLDINQNDPSFSTIPDSIKFIDWIEYDYDESGNLVKERYSNGEFNEFFYDSNKRLISTNDQFSNRTNYEYDFLNRVIKETYSDGKFIEFIYDYTGKIIATKDNQENVQIIENDETHNTINAEQIITQESEGINYKVTYNARFSTTTKPTGKVPIDSNLYSPNSNVSVLGNPGKLTATGYNFNGWNTKPDYSGTNYKTGQTFKIKSDTTLYATWARQVKVTYSANGGKGIAPVDNTVYSSGATIILPLPFRLYKEGYNAVGWMDDKANKYDFGSRYTLLSNTTFYVRWREEPGPCTSDDYGPWGTCWPSSGNKGIQRRFLLPDAYCTTEINNVYSRECTPVKCTDWWTGGWSTCVNGFQTREVMAIGAQYCYPSGTSPETKRAC